MPFFSPNPGFFRNPKHCALDNGTIIYSSHAIPSDCSCVAPFRANPDFGGPGIITFFCFSAWVTILVAAVPATYSVRKSWATTRQDEKGWRQTGGRDRLRWVGRFMIDAFQLRMTAKADTSQKARDTTSEDVSSMTTKPETPDQDPPEQQVTHTKESPILELARALLISLTDIQIVAGLACM
jgi:hypothetical protein